jgi:hypothetical protein
MIEVQLLTEIDETSLQTINRYRRVRWTQR